MKIQIAPRARRDLAARVAYIARDNPAAAEPAPPVRIYYQRRADALIVLRIYHQARRPITR